jgi:hypothetical protein
MLASSFHQETCPLHQSAETQELSAFAPFATLEEVVPGRRRWTEWRTNAGHQGTRLNEPVPRHYSFGFQGGSLDELCALHLCWTTLLEQAWRVHHPVMLLCAMQPLGTPAVVRQDAIRCM